MFWLQDCDVSWQIFANEKGFFESSVIIRVNKSSCVIQCTMSLYSEVNVSHDCDAYPFASMWWYWDLPSSPIIWLIICVSDNAVIVVSIALNYLNVGQVLTTTRLDPQANLCDRPRPIHDRLSYNSGSVISTNRFIAVCH